MERKVVSGQGENFKNQPSGWHQMLPASLGHCKRQCRKPEAKKDAVEVAGRNSTKSSWEQQERRPEHSAPPLSNTNTKIHPLSKGRPRRHATTHQAKRPQLHTAWNLTSGLRRLVLNTKDKDPVLLRGQVRLIVLTVSAITEVATRNQAAPKTEYTNTLP